MAGKLYDSNGKFIENIDRIELNLGEPTKVTLSNGLTLFFGSAKDVKIDPNNDWHIVKSRHDCLDMERYAEMAKDMLRTMHEKREPNMKSGSIKRVIFNPPATVVYWSDCTKTVVKCNVNDIFDPEKGLAMAIAKRCAGNTSAYYAEIRHWVAERGKDYPGKPYTESSSVENNCPGRPYTESSSNEKDALKKYIAQAKKSYETALEAATKGNPVNFLSEMGRVSAALSMLELEINK